MDNIENSIGMDRFTIGHLIKITREKRKISKVKLCYGLCTVTALTRYEQDIRIPDKFLADALLERLGIQAFKYEFIASDHEFNFRVKRNEIEEFIWNEETEEAVCLFENYMRELREKDILHKQYALLQKAIILKMKKQYEKCEELLAKAWNYTFPDINNDYDIGNLLLTNIEMKILYILAECWSLKGEDKKACGLYSALKKYIDDVKWDTIKRNEYYPNILYHLACYEVKKYNYGIAKEYLLEAEALLIANYRLENLYEIEREKNKVRTLMGKDENFQNNENLLTTLEIINLSNNGKITEEGIRLWESIAKQPL